MTVKICSCRLIGIVCVFGGEIKKTEGERILNGGRSLKLNYSWRAWRGAKREIIAEYLMQTKASLFGINYV